MKSPAFAYFRDAAYLAHSVMSSRATLPFESAWICIYTGFTFYKYVVLQFCIFLLICILCCKLELARVLYSVSIRPSFRCGPVIHGNTRMRLLSTTAPPSEVESYPLPNGQQGRDHEA